MKKVLVSLVVVLLVQCGSMAAVMVVADATDRFNVAAPGTTFTNWAVSNGGAAMNLTTLQDTLMGDFYLSTTPNPGPRSTVPEDQVEGTLTIPFDFNEPLNTAVLHVESYASGSYEDNAARSRVYLTVNGVKTLIYQHDDVLRPASLGGYGGYIYGSTDIPYSSWPEASTIAYTRDIDISNLVAGATSFELEYDVMAGFSGYRYNGGGFYGASSTSSDITVLSGTVVPEPATLGLLGLSVLGLIRRKK